jgi:hypothetical protein
MKWQSREVWIFFAVLTWKLDRFGRSVSDCLNGIETLRSQGVRFMATSQNIDTDQSNPVSSLDHAHPGRRGRVRTRDDPRARDCGLEERESQGSAAGAPEDGDRPRARSRNEREGAEHPVHCAQARGQRHGGAKGAKRPSKGCAKWCTKKPIAFRQARGANKGRAERQLSAYESKKQKIPVQGKTGGAGRRPVPIARRRLSPVRANLEPQVFQGAIRFALELAQGEEDVADSVEECWLTPFGLIPARGSYPARVFIMSVSSRPYTSWSISCSISPWSRLRLRVFSNEGLMNTALPPVCGSAVPQRVFCETSQVLPKMLFSRDYFDCVETTEARSPVAVVDRFRLEVDSYGGGPIG